MRKLILTFACALLLLSSTGLAAEWGTIKGKIVLKGDVPDPVLLHKKGAIIRDAEVCAAVDTYRDDLIIDKETKGIANVFVYIYKVPPKDIHPDFALSSPPPKVIFDQEKCLFKPKALIVRAGQTVEVLNSDSIAHNTHTVPFKNQGYNILVAPHTEKGQGIAIATTVQDLLAFEVKCDFHSWMKAHWLVLDHPYAAVTNAKGEFTLKNMPAGDQELRIWHPLAGYIDRKYAVTVAEGNNAPLEPVVVELSKFEEE